MDNIELVELKNKHVGIYKGKYNILLEGRSYNKDRITRLQKNLTLWSEFLKNVNQLSYEFVEELNSKEFESFSEVDKQAINSLYREEIKELVKVNNQKFILGD